MKLSRLEIYIKVTEYRLQKDMFACRPGAIKMAIKIFKRFI